MTRIAAILFVLISCRSEASDPEVLPQHETPPIAAAPPTIHDAPAQLRPSTPAVPDSAPQEAPSKRAVVVEVHQSLEASLTSVMGEDGAALSQVAKRVLVWWLDVRRDLRAGDTLRLVYEPVDAAEPRLHYVAYQSQKHGKTFEAVLFQPSGSAFPRYYEPDGREVERRLRQSPIEGYEQVTSLLGDGRRHKGVDFKAPTGTPIRATFTGKVSRRNWSTRGNGRCVELTDPETGVTAMFLHLSQVSVRVGQRVRVGDVIGLSGNTGRSTAPHLHYQLERPDGRIIDPYRYHESYRRRLEPSEDAALEMVRSELLGIAAGARVGG